MYRRNIVSRPDYIRVSYGEPHAARGRQMLTAHPELRALAGPTPTSAVWTLALVVAQLGLALWLGPMRWCGGLPCAYAVGPPIRHPPRAPSPPAHPYPGVRFAQ